MSESSISPARDDSPAAVNGAAKEKTHGRIVYDLPKGQKLTRGTCAPCRATNPKGCNKKKPICDKCAKAGIECGWAIEQRKQKGARNQEPDIYVFEEARSPSKAQAATGSVGPVPKYEDAKAKLSSQPKLKPKPRQSVKQEQRGKSTDRDMTSPKEGESLSTIRRSSRPHKPNSYRLSGNTVETDDEFDGQERSQSPTFQKSQDRAGEGVRRNSKRKAPPVDYDEPEDVDLPDELLDMTLQPPSEPAEQNGWEGWVEVESEPAFFNVILQGLGVKEVKLQEILSVDQGSLSLLPKPVHGLIFLYQYVEEDAQEETENGHNVWFANQTTDNACATLALFNIIMNARHIELGDRLRAFKQASSNLPPALKGHELSNTTWIRSLHNQFASRLDLVNADLCLSNAVDEEKKRKAVPSRLHAAKRQKKIKKPVSDAAYHFVAYVPVDGEVYQLDGLEKAPLSIGKIDPRDDAGWTAVAQPYIEARMLQYEDQQLQFNLLAVCGSPLSQHRHELATNIHSYNYLKAKLHLRHIMGQAEQADIVVSHPDGFLTFDSPAVSQYGLYYTDMNVEFGDPSPVDLLSWHGSGVGSRSVEDVRARIDELFPEQARLRAEYKTEEMNLAEEHQRAIDRKKDSTQTILEMVEMLTENGDVHDLIKEVKE